MRAKKRKPVQVVRNGFTWTKIDDAEWRLKLPCAEYVVVQCLRTRVWRSIRMAKLEAMRYLENTWPECISKSTFLEVVQVASEKDAAQLTAWIAEDANNGRTTRDVPCSAAAALAPERVAADDE